VHGGDGLRAGGDVGTAGTIVLPAPA